MLNGLPPFIVQFTLLNFMLMAKGQRIYFAARLTLTFMLLAAAIVWLATPVAMWRAFGPAWVFVWLVPTTVATYLFLVPQPSGGG